MTHERRFGEEREPGDGGSTNLQRAALLGDVDRVTELLIQRIERGDTVGAVADRWIAPAMAAIGSDWANGKLLVAQEHIASNAVCDALARLKPVVAKPGARGAAVVACLGDELHDLAIRIIDLALSAQGFSVVRVGAASPAAEVGRYVAALGPALVAMSASRGGPRLRADLAAVAAQIGTGAGIRCYVGGAGVDELVDLPPGVVRLDSILALERAVVGLK